jgi:hypothetical protein
MVTPPCILFCRSCPRFCGWATCRGWWCLAAQRQLRTAHLRRLRRALLWWPRRLSCAHLRIMQLRSASIRCTGRCPWTFGLGWRGVWPKHVHASNVCLCRYPISRSLMNVALVLFFGLFESSKDARAPKDEICNNLS